MRHRARLTAIASIGVLLLGCSACGRPLAVRYERELADTPEPARHAIQSERLRSAMRRLDQLAVERLPKEMDVGTERRQRAEGVASAARGVAHAAEAIPEAIDDVEIGDSARRDFLRLAGVLHERSLALANDALDLSAEELQERVTDVQSVCAECHDRFRILPLVR